LAGKVDAAGIEPATSALFQNLQRAQRGEEILRIPLFLAG
jgi:hypothetical protein